MRLIDSKEGAKTRHWLFVIVVFFAFLGMISWNKSPTTVVQRQNSDNTPFIFIQMAAPKAENLIDPKLAKYEPESGCYLGAYIDLSTDLEQTFTDVNNRKHRMPYEFEQQTGKQHAIYFFYLGYGQKLPIDWVRYLTTQNKFVHIALEPNDGLDEVLEDEYLNTLADDMRRSGARIFLRYASEMNGPWVKYNGDPQKYIEKWKLVTKVMRERAPNVAMLWCPYTTPERTMDEYYPGDEWVDWVGINMYNVSYFDQNPNSPAMHIKPEDMLRKIYATYAAKKPIMIGEYGTTHFSALENRKLIDFATFNIESIYRSLERKFPRVKAINYFNTNNLGLEHRRNNNYSVTQDSVVNAAYRKAIDRPYFRSIPADRSITGPSESIVRLQNGMSVSGTLKFLIWPEHHELVDAVKVLFAGRQVFIGHGPRNWTAEVDTHSVDNGKQSLEFRALSRNGKGLSSVKLSVNVAN